MNQRSGETFISINTAIAEICAIEKPDTSVSAIPEVFGRPRYYAIHCIIGPNKSSRTQQTPRTHTPLALHSSHVPTDYTSAFNLPRCPREMNTCGRPLRQILTALASLRYLGRAAAANASVGGSRAVPSAQLKLRRFAAAGASFVTLDEKTQPLTEFTSRVDSRVIAYYTARCGLF